MRKFIERIAFYILTFRRICNPPVLIIRICNPIDCSLFADGKAHRFERITNPYRIFRRIANHAETQKLPKRRSKRNAETNKTQKQTKRRNKRNTEANKHRSKRNAERTTNGAAICHVLRCKRPHIAVQNMAFHKAKSRILQNIQI